MSDAEKVACTDAMHAMIRCVQQSECVTQQGRKIRDCISDPDGVTAEGGECYALGRGYFECRRGQLDMRTRIRGNKFADNSSE